MALTHISTSLLLKIPTTSQAKAFCQTATVDARSSRFKQARAELNSIFLEAITGTGRLSPFLKKALHPIHRILKHTQIITATGGASTIPSVIKSTIKEHIYQWHRIRRSQPPTPGSASTREANDNYDKVAALYRDSWAEIPSITQPVSTDSFLATSRSVSPHSCPGESGVSARLISHCPQATIAAFTALTNACLRWAILPRQYLSALLLLIPKPGKQSLENSRPLSLLESSMKIMTRIVNNRLTYTLLAAAYFSAVQFGFLPGRTCIDPFHTLLACIEDAKSSDNPLHLCLVDLEKAFDSLESWSLKLSYKRAGLSDHDTAFLLALDGTGSSKIITPFGLTDPVNIKRGVRQGECLSSTKFIIWLEPWLQQIAADYPNLGYTLPDGTRVLLLCFADDIAILTSSHDDMQTIMTSLCAFLSFHGVTMKGEKTVYTSRTRGARPPLSLRVFQRDSTPTNILHEVIPLKHHPSSKVLKYLGGGISLDLNWTNIINKTDAAVRLDLDTLSNRRISLQQTLVIANTVLRGRAGFFLQIAPFPEAMIKKWDASLDKILKAKGRLPYSSSPAILHAPKASGGIGLFTYKGLAQAAAITGLLTRLNSPTFVGSSTRSRWHHMQNSANPYPKAAPADSLTMHCCSTARSIGYTIFQNKPTRECPGTDPSTSADLPGTIAHVRHTAATQTPLSIVIHQAQLLHKLEAQGLHYLSDITNADGSLTEWANLSNRNQPSRWYEELELLPRFNNDVRTIVAQEQIHIPQPLPATNPLLPYEPRFLQQLAGSTHRSFENPPTPTTDKPHIVFFTDGSIKLRRGTPHGGHSSITLYDVPGWPRSTVRIRPKGTDSYPLQIGRRLSAYLVLGDEPVAVDTMELAALLDIAENAPMIDIVVYVDPTYITKNLPNMGKLSTLRLTRFSNRHLWIRLLAAITRRESHGHKLTVLKCAAHDKDPTQHPHVSLGNWVADVSAKEAAAFSAPITDWLPDDQTLFSLAYKGKLVRGDPRRHVRRTIADRSLQHLATLKVEGMSTHLALEGHVNKQALTASRNPLTWIPSARQSIHPFALALQGRALRSTPSKTFRSKKNKNAQHLTLVPTTNVTSQQPTADSTSGNESTTDNTSDWEETPARRKPKTKPAHRSASHRPLCPLCTSPSAQQGDHPDTWHAMCTCSTMQSHRETIQLECYGVVRPLDAPPGLLIPHLHRWLKTATNNPNTPLFHIPDTVQVDSTFPLTNGFHIINQDQLKAGQRLPPDTSSVIHFPANRFPKSPSDTTRTPNPKSVLLLHTGKETLPVLSPSMVSALADILRHRLWLGTYGLLLRWKPTAWALDRAPSNYPRDVAHTLSRYHLLPSINSRPTHLGWNDSLTWLALMPTQPLDHTLPSKLNKQLLNTLTAAILLGQEATYNSYKTLVAQALHSRRRAQGNQNTPKKRPLFTAYDPTKAKWPLSTRQYNLAQQYLQETNSATPPDYNNLEDWAVRHGIHRNGAHSLWLAVLGSSDQILVTPAVIKKPDAHHPDFVHPNDTRTAPTDYFPHLTKSQLSRARSLIADTSKHVGSLDPLKQLDPELLDHCIQRFNVADTCYVYPIEEAAALMAEGHSNNNPTATPDPSSRQAEFLDNTSRRDFTLLPLSFKDGETSHWLLASIQKEFERVKFQVSIWNPQPGRFTQQALYGVLRLLRPIDPHPSTAIGNCRKQPPFINDSGPITLYNVAWQMHLANNPDDTGRIPFPRHLRLRMALLAEDDSPIIPSAPAPDSTL